MSLTHNSNTPAISIGMFRLQPSILYIYNNLAFLVCCALLVLELLFLEQREFDKVIWQAGVCLFTDNNDLCINGDMVQRPGFRKRSARSENIKRGQKTTSQVINVKRTGSDCFTPSVTCQPNTESHVKKRKKRTEA